MTAEDLDELARMLRVSHDAPEHTIRVMARRECCDAVMAMYQAGSALIALARESIAARETYRVECPDYRPPHEREGEWEVLASGHSLEWCRGYVDSNGDEVVRIVRERDGEVVT